MRLKILTVSVIFLIGCKVDQSGIKGDEPTDASLIDTKMPPRITYPPTTGAPSAGGTTDPAPTVKSYHSFWLKDFSRQVTDPDSPWLENVNTIYSCASDPDGSRRFCAETCLALVAPQWPRYSLLSSGRLEYQNGGEECRVTAIRWDDALLTNKQTVIEYVGDYTRTGASSVGTCGNFVERGDSASYLQIKTTQLEQGEVSPHPSKWRLFEELKYFDSNVQEFESHYLLSYSGISIGAAQNKVLQPAYYFSYIEDGIKCTVTYQILNGADCIRESQIDGFLNQ